METQAIRPVDEIVAIDLETKWGFLAGGAQILTAVPLAETISMEPVSPITS